MGVSQTVQFTRQILQSGIPPFTMLYTPVIATSGSSHKAYRTNLQINAAGIGTLMPQDYIGVANRSVQCIKLFEKSIKLVAAEADRVAPRNEGAEWISVYAPEKLIKRKNSAKLVTEAVKASGMSHPERLCFEFSAEAVYDDADEVADFLAEIKRIGCKTSVGGIGGEFSPVARLAVLPFDFAVLDKEFTKLLEDKKRIPAAISLIAYIKSLGKRVIVTGVAERHIAAIEQAAVFGYLPENTVYSRAEAMALSSLPSEG